jgi:DNA mismatch repair protein MutS2
MGKSAARALTFTSSRIETLRRLAEAKEATSLRAGGQALVTEELPDVRDAVARLRIGGALGGAELLSIGRVLGAARTLRRALSARRESSPALHAACSTDPTLDDLDDEISRCFEDDGTLADRASPRLRELRSEFSASRARMLSRLDDLMTRYEGIVQERFVTEREGRYVIPVRSDAHERFPGIVHATSGSGSTLFVEPRAVVPMGNRLKMLESEVAREELAICGRLSDLLVDALPSLDAACTALALADVLSAIAELARDLELSFPTVASEPTMSLKAARHPLLSLDALHSTDSRDPAARRGLVVPSDLSIEPGRGIVVSGPNAGGKTVALKTMGLAALMLRAGLPVACDEGSTLGLFDVVLTDVGDDQNLTKSLSTFSAHVRNLAAILEETRTGALVLLDELAGGTDPREGEALAAGVLDSLLARGGAVVATTHYEGLKALALADDRFENASVGFDLATMTPTFRLILGVPGGSSALAVAARFGLPSTVIDRATRFLSREDQSFETLVKQLNAERAALDLARQAADAREAAARARELLLEEEIVAAKDREARLLTKETESLLLGLRRAKDDLRAAQARLRGKSLDEPAVREAARAIDRVAAQTAIGGELEGGPNLARGDDRQPIRVEDLRRGSRVFVAKLRALADVLEVAKNGAVRVAIGPMKLNVSVADLRVAEESPPEARRPSARRAAPRDADASATAPIRTSDNTCDLKGLRVDDALTMATAFMDRALNDGRGVVFLVHGHGTGAIRESLRKELGVSRYVERFRPGESAEGGDAVTVVWLA